MPDQSAPAIGRKSLADRRKPIKNPFPAGIGDYHESHPLSGGAAAADPTPAPAVAPVQEPPAREAAAAQAAPAVAPAPAEDLQLEQPKREAAAHYTAPGGEESSGQDAQPATGPEPEPSVQAQDEVHAAGPSPEQPDPAPPARAEPTPEPAAAKRPKAPRISELNPVHALPPLGEGLYDDWLTGKIVDYPRGVQFEDYKDLDFSDGYNLSFKRREARIPPIVDEWLETVARYITKAARASGNVRHQNDARMRANSVLRTALEKGLLDLEIEGATSEAELRELNGLPPAPEQLLFDRVLADKMQEQLDRSAD